MKFNNQAGYILLLNLLLITMISLFIPLLVQQQKLNFMILNNRKKSAQNREIVDSALQYQLYHFKEKKILLDDQFILENKFKVFVLGEEDDDFVYFKARLNNNPAYESEMKIRKSNMETIYKKIYRSE
ncbi:hypothetical protein [Halanaerobium praevalens]|uniref:Uncharacterized protein n=1 Tax=Halanaerobium praevalens (strain ATCC 33744 / DSM 2228 / GSL) TaxID=572479 RepID=E3DRI7_HALPG|nr:hypothetical protein [Halanaerobium praevalens]ADO77028.1 hypothetical protein Hprae_0874 [Halanaerobium praevalens DSM 2228]